MISKSHNITAQVSRPSVNRSRRWERQRRASYSTESTNAKPMCRRSGLSLNLSCAIRPPEHLLNFQPCEGLPLLFLSPHPRGNRREQYVRNVCYRPPFRIWHRVRVDTKSCFQIGFANNVLRVSDGRTSLTHPT